MNDKEYLEKVESIYNELQNCQNYFFDNFDATSTFSSDQYQQETSQNLESFFDLIKE